jgi:uncharacterized protein YndB with AHSA1/START domain
MTEYIINSDLDTCRNAWLDEKRLKHWLAEAAEIRGDEFLLTSILPNVSGRHRLSSKDDTKLVFDWYVDGFETKLIVKFESVSEGTRVSVTHDFPSPLPIGISYPGGEHYGDQVWNFALYQLKSVIETGERAMTLSWPYYFHEIEHEIMIDASVAKVWQALTQVEHLKKMELVSDDVIVDPRIGGRYSFGWSESEDSQTDGPGYITEWEQEERLSYSWYGGRDSIIRWELFKLGDSTTRIRFTHSGLIFSFADAWSYKLGWADHLLELKRYLKSPRCEFNPP